MFKKILSLFKKGQEQSFVSNVDFKDSIKALGIGRYRGITIMYLSKPVAGKNEQPIYHFWRRQDEDLFFGEADTYEELKILARNEIDALLDR